jgi:hypothetical protein
MKYQSIKKRTQHYEDVKDNEVAKSLIPSDIHFLLDYERTNVVHCVYIYNTIFEAKRFPALHGWMQEMQLKDKHGSNYYDISDSLVYLRMRHMKLLMKTLQEVLLDKSKAEELFPNKYISFMDKDPMEYPIDEYYWDYMSKLYNTLSDITQVSGNDDEEYVYQVQELWA